ncbi:hypothetical protein D3C76_1804950 [compost metagenome]
MSSAEWIALQIESRSQQTVQVHIFGFLSDGDTLGIGQLLVEAGTDCGGDREADVGFEHVETIVSVGKEIIGNLIFGEGLYII